MTENSRPRVLSGAPKALFWIGLALLVVGVGIAIGGVVATVRSAPLDVLTMNGEPGSGVLGVVDAPGAGVVELQPGVEYSFVLVGPKGSSPYRLDGAIAVTGPDGAAVDVVRGSSAGFSIGGGDRSGRVVSAVVPELGGGHAVVVPQAEPSGAQVLVAEVPATSSFAIGLFGGVAGIVLGSLLGTAGFFLLLGGLVWGMIRSGSQSTPR